MLDSQIAKIDAQLKQALGAKELFVLGRETGFEKRARSITTLRFVTSLVQSLGSRRVESIADLLRDFNRDHDTEIYYKPYYNRLDCPEFPELMRQVFEAMMSGLCTQVLKPAKDGPFRRFKDIVVHDGTSFALHAPHDQYRRHAVRCSCGHMTCAHDQQPASPFGLIVRRRGTVVRRCMT